jgi:hypothetical protein
MRSKKNKHPVEQEREEIHRLLNKILNPPIDRDAGNEVLARIPTLLRTVDNYHPPLPERRRANIQAELEKIFLEATAIMSSKS